MGGVPLILESFVAFDREVSVIAARSISGEISAFDLAENVHRNGILHTSTLPRESASQRLRQQGRRQNAFFPAFPMSASSV